VFGAFTAAFTRIGWHMDSHQQQIWGSTKKNKFRNFQ